MTSFQDIPPIFQGDLIFYTDGSYKSIPLNTASGSGVVLVAKENISAAESNEQWKEQLLIRSKIIFQTDHPFFMKADKETNNTAELQAIGIALKMSMLYGGQKLIRSDSEYAIGVVTGKMIPEVNKLMVQHIQELLEEAKEIASNSISENTLDSIMQKQNSIVFEHVKAHAQEKYNEMADKLAGEVEEMVAAYQDTTFTHDIRIISDFADNYLLAHGNTPDEDEKEEDKSTASSHGNRKSQTSLNIGRSQSGHNNIRSQSNSTPSSKLPTFSSSESGSSQSSSPCSSPANSISSSVTYTSDTTRSIRSDTESSGSIDIMLNSNGGTQLNSQESIDRLPLNNGQSCMDRLMQLFDDIEVCSDNGDAMLRFQLPRPDNDHMKKKAQYLFLKFMEALKADDETGSQGNHCFTKVFLDNFHVLQYLLHDKIINPHEQAENNLYWATDTSGECAVTASYQAVQFVSTGQLPSYNGLQLKTNERRQ